MFLRCKVRRKDGKQHRYWSVVENTRLGGGRVVQRHVLYLGEINDTQELAWRRSIEVLEDGAARPRTLSLFPEDRVEGLLCTVSGFSAARWPTCWPRQARSAVRSNRARQFGRLVEPGHEFFYSIKKEGPPASFRLKIARSTISRANRRPETSRGNVEQAVG